MYTCFTSTKLDKSNSKPGEYSLPTRMPLNKCVKCLLFAHKLYFHNSVTSDCLVGSAEVPPHSYPQCLLLSFSTSRGVNLPTHPQTCWPITADWATREVCVHFLIHHPSTLTLVPSPLYPNPDTLTQRYSLFFSGEPHWQDKVNRRAIFTAKYHNLSIQSYTSLPAY